MSSSGASEIQGWTLYGWFRRSWQSNRQQLLVLLATTFASAALSASFPWLWQYLFVGKGTALGPEHLLELGRWMLVVALLQGLFQIVLHVVRSLVNASAEQALRSEVLRRLCDVSRPYYATWPIGELHTRLLDDAGSKTAWFFGSDLMILVESVLTCVACIACMLCLDARLTLNVILPIPILLAIQVYAVRALDRRYVELQTTISTTTGDLATLLSAVRGIQAARLEQLACARFDRSASCWQRAELRVAVVQQAVLLLATYGWQLVVAALLLTGGQRVLSGALPVGRFLAFEGYTLAMMTAVYGTAMFATRYRQARIGLNRLSAITQEPTVRTKSITSATCETSESAISILGLTVQGSDGKTLTRDISLHVGLGQYFALVGKSGSGKSSVLRACAGLVRPSRGSVWIGGIVPTALHSSANLVAYVPQDSVLLSATLRDNIAVGRRVPEELLERALRTSRLEADLHAFPNRLETVVGERGMTLSGGQQQRVMLARALLGSPKILLLDDATAALDAKTEAEFWTYLATLYPKLTLLFVTHRLAALDAASSVVVMESGAIVEVGRSRDLLVRSGRYSKLHAEFADAERRHGNAQVETIG